MRIFHYHPTTGEFIETSMADESPLEPGVFAVPAHATEIEPPPPKAGFVAVFDKVSWKLHEIQKPAEENLESHPVTEASVRAERHSRLLLCDWTQLPDADLTMVERSAWKAYRTALRNVTDQPGFPTNVMWPTVPN